jgi:DNA repair exonuclease SbcCD ATPase subunit
VVNDLTNKECCVEIEFDVGGKEYKVVRGIKPNIFEVWCQGQKLNQNTDSRDYQEILEKQILRCNFKSFCQVVILGSDTYVPFMKLSVPKRREIIEGLLDLDVFSVMTSILKTKITDLGNIIKDKTCEREKVEQRISLLEMSREELQKNNNSVIADYEKNKDGLLVKVKEIEKRICNLQELVWENIENKNNVNSDIDEKMESYNAIRIKCRSEMDSIDGEIEFLTKHDICPTCRQKINDEFRNETLNKKTNRYISLDEIYESALRKCGILHDEKKIIDAASNQIAAHRADMDREFSRIEDFRHQIATIDS